MAPKKNIEIRHRSTLTSCPRVFYAKFVTEIDFYMKEILDEDKSICFIHLYPSIVQFSLSLGAQQWLIVILVQLMKAGKHPDMSEKLLTRTYCMRGSRNFCQGGPGPTARKHLFLVLNLFYSLTMVYFKQNYNFQRGSNIFQGGPTFSRGEMICRGRVLTYVVITCVPTPLLYIFGNKICLN